MRSSIGTRAAGLKLRKPFMKKTLALFLLLALTIGSLVGGLAVRADGSDAGISAGDGGSSQARVQVLDREMQSLLEKIGPAYVLFAAGSGVCISPDGYVLTNHHVAPEGARRYRADRQESEIVLAVSFSGGRQYSARPVGADPRGDIVLVKLDLKEGETVPYVELGNSDAVRIGDLAVAIGNPFLLAGFASEPSVSVGVVSATNRAQGGYTRTIQTDAALNPGNSGGPLFDIQGRLIGINGRILTSHGMRYNTGAGFAIPVNQIKLFIERFKDPKDRGLIVRHGLVAGLAMVHDSRLLGAAVFQVRSGSAADTAGLRSGDVIQKVDGDTVRGVAGFFNLVSSYPQHSTVTLSVLREEPNGQTSNFEVTVPLEVPVTLNQAPQFPSAEPEAEQSFIFQNLRRGSMEAAMERSNPFQFGASSVVLGVSLSEVELEMPALRGLQISDIGSSANNPSAARELKIGDVVLEAGGRRVSYFSDLKDVLLGYRSGQEFPMRVLRDGKEIEVEVKLLRAGRRR